MNPTLTPQQSLPKFQSYKSDEFMTRKLNKFTYCYVPASHFEYMESEESGFQDIGHVSTDGKFSVSGKGDQDDHDWCPYLPDQYPQFVKVIFAKHGVTGSSFNHEVALEIVDTRASLKGASDGHYFTDPSEI